MVTSSPFVLVVFGATGDLMARKLMPAVYTLLKDNYFGSPPLIVGVGRRKISESEFRQLMAKAIRDVAGASFDQTIFGRLEPQISYLQGFFEDPDLYRRLVSRLTQFDTDMKSCVPRFYYLATPPQNYETILSALGKSKLSQGCLPASLAQTLAAGGQGFDQYARILIEKPFGKDLKTAKALENLLSTVFKEKQIYRIDHYLDKETVQNILAIRFANGIFEPTWNKGFIDHVQISLLEQAGIGARGAFYDGVGALRDVVQNHVLQMLAFTAMDQPKAFDSDNLRRARRHVVESIMPIKPEAIATTVVRGQYGDYQKEKNVQYNSQTETFVALKLFLDTPRWRGVPFYIRTGKKLESKVTEISLHFKKPVVCTGPLCLFPEPQVKRNVLVIRISPGSGIGFRLMAKAPGLGMDLTSIEMAQVEKQGETLHGEYEKLLLDAIRADQTLFAHSGEVEASWNFVTKILDNWETKHPLLHVYTPGSWGPKEADEFIEKDGRHWFLSGS